MAPGKRAKEEEDDGPSKAPAPSVRKSVARSKLRKSVSPAPRATAKLQRKASALKIRSSSDRHPDRGFHDRWKPQAPAWKPEVKEPRQWKPFKVKTRSGPCGPFDKNDKVGPRPPTDTERPPIQLAGDQLKDPTMDVAVDLATAVLPRNRPLLQCSQWHQVKAPALPEVLPPPGFTDHRLQLAEGESLWASLMPEQASTRRGSAASSLRSKEVTSLVGSKRASANSRGGSLLGSRAGGSLLEKPAGSNVAAALMEEAASQNIRSEPSLLSLSTECEMVPDTIFHPEYLSPPPKPPEPPMPISILMPDNWEQVIRVPAERWPRATVGYVTHLLHKAVRITGDFVLCALDEDEPLAESLVLADVFEPPLDLRIQGVRVTTIRATILVPEPNGKANPVQYEVTIPSTLEAHHLEVLQQLDAQLRSWSWEGLDEMVLALAGRDHTDFKHKQCRCPGCQFPSMVIDAVELWRKELQKRCTEVTKVTSRGNVAVDFDQCAITLNKELPWQQPKPRSPFAKHAATPVDEPVKFEDTVEKKEEKDKILNDVAAIILKYGEVVTVEAEYEEPTSPNVRASVATRCSKALARMQHVMKVLNMDHMVPSRLLQEGGPGEAESVRFVVDPERGNAPCRWETERGAEAPLAAEPWPEVDQTLLSSGGEEEQVCPGSPLKAEHGIYRLQASTVERGQHVLVTQEEQVLLDACQRSSCPPTDDMAECLGQLGDVVKVNLSTKMALVRGEEIQDVWFPISCLREVQLAPRLHLFVQPVGPTTNVRIRWLWSDRPQAQLVRSAEQFRPSPQDLTAQMARTETRAGLRQVAAGHSQAIKAGVEAKGAKAWKPALQRGVLGYTALGAREGEPWRVLGRASYGETSLLLRSVFMLSPGSCYATQLVRVTDDTKLLEQECIAAGLGWPADDLHGSLRDCLGTEGVIDSVEEGSVLAQVRIPYHSGIVRNLPIRALGSMTPQVHYFTVVAHCSSQPGRPGPKSGSIRDPGPKRQERQRPWDGERDDVGFVSSVYKICIPKLPVLPPERVEMVSILAERAIETKGWARSPSQLQRKHKNASSDEASQLAVVSGERKQVEMVRIRWQAAMGEPEYYRVYASNGDELCELDCDECSMGAFCGVDFPVGEFEGGPFVSVCSVCEGEESQRVLAKWVVLKGTTRPQAPAPAPELEIVDSGAKDASGGALLCADWKMDEPGARYSLIFRKLSDDDVPAVQLGKRVRARQAFKSADPEREKKPQVLIEAGDEGFVEKIDKYSGCAQVWWDKHGKQWVDSEDYALLKRPVVQKRFILGPKGLAREAWGSPAALAHVEPKASRTAGKYVTSSPTMITVKQQFSVNDTATQDTGDWLIAGPPAYLPMARLWPGCQTRIVCMLEVDGQCGVRTSPFGKAIRPPPCPPPAPEYAPTLRLEPRPAGPEVHLHWIKPFAIDYDVSYDIVVKVDDGREADVSSDLKKEHWRVALWKLSEHFANTYLQFGVVTKSDGLKSPPSQLTPPYALRVPHKNQIPQQFFATMGPVDTDKPAAQPWQRDKEEEEDGVTSADKAAQRSKSLAVPTEKEKQELTSTLFRNAGKQFTERSEVEAKSPILRGVTREMGTPKKAAWVPTKTAGASVAAKMAGVMVKRQRQVSPGRDKSSKEVDRFGNPFGSPKKLGQKTFFEPKDRRVISLQSGPGGLLHS